MSKTTEEVIKRKWGGETPFFSFRLFQTPQKCAHHSFSISLPHTHLTSKLKNKKKSNTKMNKKKSVQFSTSIEVHEIPPVSSNSDSSCCCTPTITAEEKESTFTTTTATSTTTSPLLPLISGRMKELIFRIRIYFFIGMVRLRICVVLMRTVDYESWRHLKLC